MIASGTGIKEEKLSATAERFCRRFSLVEIQWATDNFSDENLIGKGGFGKVYKGQFDDGQPTVAMKRLAPNSNQGEGEFLTEIETLSMLRHVNLVSLIGYCNENGEMILVYEYIPRGTLADHLYKLPGSSESDDCSSLAWKQRLNICIGAGRGLDYLHTGTSIIHRDVKSTNILLDENYTAKVSDFGMAKHLGTSSSQSHVSTIVKGSFGYLDPSYFVTCRLTRKSDTYAFGVVLLEVLCGRPAVDQRLGEDEMSLVMWAQDKISKGKAYQIVASNLRDEISDDCLKTFVGIAKRCLNHDPKKRPTMAQVVVQLEFALEQQDKKEPTLNASRFLSFWSRVKPSVSGASGSTEKDQKHSDAHALSTAITAISIHELKDITDDFSSECFDGNVYRGVLKSGQVAAIKKLIRSLPDKVFPEQVSFVSSLKHENVAQLLGYCVYDDQQILAYEFAPNGSVYDILNGQHGVNGSKLVPCLSWAQRVKIAIGAAKGLQYIHEKGQGHCNIRSSNILLFDDYEVAKLTDLGQLTHYSYGRQVYSGGISSLQPCATYQWLEFCGDPRWYGEQSWRNDVFSFGVVLLELLTGGKLVDHTRPRGQWHLLNWAKARLSEDRTKELVDPKLNGDYPPKAGAEMVAIATSCLQQEPVSRPAMSIVVRDLCSLLDYRVKPSESCVTGSTEKDHKQGDVHTQSTAITDQEVPLKDEHTVTMLPVTVPAISIHELKDITDNFSSEYLIHKGCNRNVYRGTQKSGQDVAIKKLSYSLSILPDKEIPEQVSLVSSLKHENVAQLLSYCVDGWQQFLVYEFAPNGSLHDIIRGQLGVDGSKPVPCLSWAQRVKIAVGAAKGLQYIHGKGLVHRNIRSSNVLLFDDYQVAKLTGFGQSTFSTYDCEVNSEYYHSPEYVQNVELSWRSDVYSFGVLLLQLLTHMWPTGQHNLVEGDCPTKAVAEMYSIAASCVQYEPESRPDMSMVVRRLNNLAEQPTH